MTSNILIVLDWVNSLTVCGPQVDTLVYCKRLKSPTSFKKNTLGSLNADTVHPATSTAIFTELILI